jgi:hypothetical protein
MGRKVRRTWINLQDKSALCACPNFSDVKLIGQSKIQNHTSIRKKLTYILIKIKEAHKAGQISKRG